MNLKMMLVFGSGLILMDNITWITFESAYDFGYLLAQLNASKLPKHEAEFKKNMDLLPQLVGCQ